MIENTIVKKTVVYDSGRFPFWWRIPGALFAVLVGIIAGRLVLGALDLPWGIPGEGSLSKNIFAILGLLAIGWMFGFLWFAQVQVMFDSDSREVVVRKRGYFGWFENQYGLRDAERLELHQVRTGLCSRRWILNIRSAGGGTEEIVLLPEADKVADMIGQAAALPVVRPQV